MTVILKNGFLALLGNFWFTTGAVEGLRAEKIVGRNVALHEGDFKYAVAVMYISESVHKNPCAGTILTDMLIATVAHCFSNETGQLRNAYFYIPLSMKNLQEIPYLPTRHIDIDTVTIHSTYNPLASNTYSAQGNLAIVLLKYRFGLRHRHLYLIKLLARYFALGFWYGTFRVAGFGYNEVNLVQEYPDGPFKEIGSTDGKLRYAHASVISTKDCMDMILNYIVPGNMCAILEPTKFSQGVGICKYDSGAPLMHDKYFDVIAIHGFPKCVEDLLPGIYIDVGYYYPWIAIVYIGNITSEMYVIQLTKPRPDEFEFQRIF